MGAEAAADHLDDGAFRFGLAADDDAVDERYVRALGDGDVVDEYGGAGCLGETA